MDFIKNNIFIFIIVIIIILYSFIANKKNYEHYDIEINNQDEELGPACFNLIPKIMYLHVPCPTQIKRRYRRKCGNLLISCHKRM